jgi:hypothetical protein
MRYAVLPSTEGGELQSTDETKSVRVSHVYIDSMYKTNSHMSRLEGIHQLVSLVAIDSEGHTCVVLAVI